MADIAYASQGCTCFNLRRLTRTVTRLYDQHLASAGLTTTQFSLLHHIWAQPSAISELAARMSTERTTITRNLKALVDAGWVELQPGPDPRQRIASITESGRATARAARHAWKQAQTELEKTVGIQKVGQLHADLNEALALLSPLLDKEQE